jgi:5-bromo-4-chloroindolyl phosphate hydrolysis protein
MKFCIIFAIGAYFILKQVMQRQSPEEKRDPAPGISRKSLDDAVRKVRDTARDFDRLANDIDKREIVEVVRNISKTLREIAYNFEDDPSDIEMSRTFIEKRLGEAVDIVSAYARLSRRSLDDRGQSQLLETEDAIRRIDRGFAEHLQRCLSNDLSKLRVDQKMTEYFYPDPESKTPVVESNDED